MPTLTFRSLAWALAGTFPATLAAQTADSYVITHRADSVRLIHVDATLQLRDTLLYMVPWGGESAPDGWRTFVKNERATDLGGHPVALRRIVDRRWAVTAPANQIIRLSYDVDVQHDRGQWIPDAREGGYALADRVFIVGRGLFVLPSFELSNVRIDVKLPAGWKTSVPWEPVTGTANAYIAPTRRDLVESTLLSGSFIAFDVREGGMTVAYALGEELAAQRTMFEDATRRMLAEHVAVFGGPPAWSRLQVVVNPDPTRRGSGGGVFRRSISMTFTTPPTAAGIFGWGHTFSHEFFHTWNAATLLRNSPAEEWFLEGGGDYYGVLGLARAKLITTDAYFGKLSQAYRRYQRVAGRLSLAAAGDQENTPPGPELLYNGGWSTYLALDLDLRAKSRGNVTMDQVLRDLYRRTLSGALATVSNAELLATINRLSGADYSAFFRDHVTGQVPLLLGQYLAPAGLALDDDGTIHPDPKATPAAAALLAAYLRSGATP